MTSLHRTANKILVACLGILAVGIAAFQMYYFSVFTVDDAYISYRYAENFANGDGLVFNKGEYVEGYTNFLWVILLGTFKKVGIDVRLSSLGLGALCSIIALFLTILLSWQISTKQTGLFAQEWSTNTLKMAAALYIATTPAFGIWSVAGLETPLFLCLLTSAVWLHLREEAQSKVAPISSICFGLLALTRPEGIMYFGLTFLYRVAYRFQHQRHRLWELGKQLFVFFCLVGPHILWRWHYYGRLLPNTYYMKVGGEFHLSGIKYVYAFFLNYGGTGLFLVCGLLLILNRTKEYWIGYFLLLLGTSALYFIYVGGDWMPAFRFFVPLLPIFFLWIQEGIRELFLHISTKNIRWAKFGSVTVALAVLLNNAYLFYNTPRIDSHLDGHVEIGKFLRRHASPDDLLAAIDIGAMAYFSGLRTIDYFGLTDTYIASLEPQTYTFTPDFWGHKTLRLKSDPDYVLSQNPTFIELNTKNAPYETTQTIPADPYSDLMLRNQSFRALYYPIYHAGGTTIFARKK